MFVNLSNHPSATWSPKQRAAAEDLAGELCDEPFPEVSPDSGPADIARLAAPVVAKLRELRPGAVMVQGEFTLTFRLVGELRRQGIACYAATRRRAANADDFDFVRFREYV